MALFTLENWPLLFLSAAMVVGSKEPEGSKRLIEFLASEKARTALRKSGMEPPKSR